MNNPCATLLKTIKLIITLGISAYLIKVSELVCGCKLQKGRTNLVMA